MSAPLDVDVDFQGTHVPVGLLEFPLLVEVDGVPSPSVSHRIPRTAPTTVPLPPLRVIRSTERPEEEEEDKTHSPEMEGWGGDGGKGGKRGSPV